MTLLSHKKMLFCLVFLALLPAPSQGESEPSPFRWTIGYESYRQYTSGPILRRFLGNNWEVFLSGGPNDLRRSETTQGWDEYYQNDSLLVLDTDQKEGSDKREEGWVMVGGGRRIVSDGGFWLTAVLGVVYSWKNYQYSDYSEWTEDTNPNSPWSLKTRDEMRVGHSQNLVVILGLRPAYDVTSRITLAMYIGVSFEKRGGVEDDHDRTTYFDLDGRVLGLSESHERTTFDSKNLDTFGVTGTSYISFFFRF